MEKGGGGGGGRSYLHWFALFPVVPALLPGRRVECGSLTPRRISPGDLCILCRLLLTVPRLVSLFHGRAVPGSPFMRLRLSSQALSVRKEGGGDTGRSRVLGLPARPHGVSRLRSGAQRLSERVSPCIVCFPAISAPPPPPRICRDAELSY
ncbi:hypothetical protein NDU88_002100 [Pleurodeles waltl]|uniref:Secreted protein n=1 Tax=Pleurodeles waltl TaxID=8319 RepID=A0AAV7W0X2_PLEWA|nr:hypothetical protein NDU88_002100 [Pleurodeles waltl]